MSTLFVRHWQFVDVLGEEPLMVVGREDIVVSSLVASVSDDSNSSFGHCSISGALQPAVPAAINPYAAGKELDWSTSSFLHRPKSDMSILYRPLGDEEEEINIFWGLISRWTNPSPCKCPNPLAICFIAFLSSKPRAISFHSSLLLSSTSPTSPSRFSITSANEPGHKSSAI